MNSITPFNMMIILTLVIFAIGLVTFITGLVLLAIRTGNRELKTIAAQTSQMAQKGIAEDVAGLVGHATNLVDAMNQMVRTSAGIGVFVTLLGLLLMAAGCFLGYKILTVS